MEELTTEYEVVVVGTGLVECIVAAAAARVGKKVLHIDQNDYYGGKWASFTLQGLDQWRQGLSQPNTHDNSDGAGLGEGEKAVATCDPTRGYSKVKQAWHVPKEEPAEDEAAKGDGAAGGEGGEAAEDKDKGAKKWTQDAMLKLTRKFNIDLAPKLLYSRGSLVELLISSNVARYTEFKCITRLLTWHSTGEGERLVQVPCSRSDVFTATSISIVEKRLLMKVLESCQSYDKHPEQFEEYNEKPFVEFLQSRNLTDNLVHYVTEAIAMVGRDAKGKEGLDKMKLFLSSLGRYGTTPFLFSMYGCGELPQAFCRLCAVFEGTYVLRRGVSSLVVGADGRCCGVVSDGQRFSCSHLVMDVDYAPQALAPPKNVATKKCLSRAVFLTDGSICPHEKEQLTFLRFPAKNGNPQAVNVLEVGSGSGVCPKDLFCVQMTCEGSDAEEDLKAVVAALFAAQDSTDADKPRVLWSLYFNQDDFSGVDMTCEVDNLYLCGGPDSHLDYDTAITEAEALFKRMFPGEEFLPRAPDPEEIVFDNAGAEPKEGDNFETKEEEDTPKESDDS